ncbi:MAG: hypothetical protein AAGF97_09305 [Planctomycetota bacterium]
MTLDESLMWRGYFAGWPEKLERRGVAVTAWGEQIVFGDFLMAEHFVMLVRDVPDANGGRRVILTYGNIAAIKVTAPVGDDIFLESSFVKTVAKAKQK